LVTRVNFTARGIEYTTNCLSNASYVSTTAIGYRSISSKELVQPMKRQ
jgi:hypothetical protein